MKQNRKTQFHKNALIAGAACVGILSVFSSCKTATAADLTATANSQFKSAEATLDCFMQYSDKSLGTTPAFSKSFTAKVGGATSEATMQVFGVSPSDGAYFASVAPNLNSNPSTDVVLMIGNGTTQVKAMSLGSSSAPMLHLAFDIAAGRVFSLTCQRSA